MKKIGIDVGSTYTKYCIADDCGKILKLCKERTPIHQKEYLLGKTEEFIEQYGDVSIVSCGYGKENVGAAKSINELTALARGAYHLLGENCVILDIGGQDTKVVLQEEGKLKKFFVNDRCAAGCGMFFLNTLNLLQMDYSDVHLPSYGRPEKLLSSVCAVFAQSEIVQLLAENTNEQEIVHAVLYHIFVQARALLAKLPAQSLVLSGGLAQVGGIKNFAANVLGCEIVIQKEAAFFSAIGCCC